ncbi:MAG: hypothetical protein ACRENG_37180 [bacterium]
MQRVQNLEFPLPHKVLINPHGHEKMSEVIMEFARPMLDKSTDDEITQNIISFAILAWNLALHKEQDTDEAYQKLHDMALSSYTDEIRRKQFHDFLDMLLQRKREYFADYKRFILDYELSFTRDSMHFDVVSTV